jgi:hypothetical protein
MPVAQQPLARWAHPALNRIEDLATVVALHPESGRAEQQAHAEKQESGTENPGDAGAGAHEA